MQNSLYLHEISLRHHFFHHQRTEQLIKLSEVRNRVSCRDQINSFNSFIVSCACLFICKLDQQRKNWRITRKLIVSKAAVPSECCYTTMQLLPLRYKTHLCSQTERLLFSLRCRLHKSCRFVFCPSAGHFPRQHILVGAKKLHFLDSKIQAQIN